MKLIMKRIVGILTTVETAICATAFAVMVLSCFLQVVNRNIIQSPALSWTEEIARYSMIWMALFGTQIGLRHGKQMSVGFFTDKLAPKKIMVIDFFADVCCLVFAAVTFYYSVIMLQSLAQSGQTSTALKIPMVAMYSSVTISFFVMMTGKVVELASYFVLGENPHKKEEADLDDDDIIADAGNA